MKKNNLIKITPQKENLSKWFLDVLLQGNLIDYGLVKGSLILKPNAFRIWENIQQIFNKKFKEEEIENVYLPLLIPHEYLIKEKKHFKGFNPQLAFITKVGEKKLNEHYVIRPTSEILFCFLFEKELKTTNNLPIKYNQWANIVRWEKTTFPLLRNIEFLWQEGHGIFATEKEANEYSLKMIKIYSKLLAKYLAIPTIIGEKTERERFAGAINTYTVEAMLKNGKSLQSGTSHYLGTNFTKVMKVLYKDKNNIEKIAHHSSWGVSTRLLGALAFIHSDDRGFVCPPAVSRYQVVIIDIMGDKNPKVRDMVLKVNNLLSKSLSVKVDLSNKSYGYKVSQADIEGIPLKIEIGPKNISNKSITITRRDTLKKEEVKFSDLENRVKTILNSIQKNLLKKAQKKLNDNIKLAFTYKEFKDLIAKKYFVLVPFAGNQKDEEKIQKETFATARCIPFDKKYKLEKEHKCILTNKKTKNVVLFAKAY